MDISSVLIVGGGSTGQAFGLALSKGGAAVSYLVRPAQTNAAREGFQLYRLRRFRAPVGERLVPDHVFDNTAGAERTRWDAVWLCVASTALRGRWLEDLRNRTGDSTIVSIGQDADDRATLEALWPAEQIVQVAPAVFAYKAPLAGERFDPSGTAFWVPPGATVAVSGPERRARPVSRALSSGGMRARHRPAGGGEMAAALNIPYVALLESKGWSLHAARRELRHAAAAAREATSVVATVHDLRPPRRLATSPFVARLALAAFKRLAPFDLEGYARVQFTKVAAQTRLMLDGWIDEGRARNLPIAQTERLRSALPTEPA
jgi:Ketopantoate reductase PanE/ApbA